MDAISGPFCANDPIPSAILSVQSELAMAKATMGMSSSGAMTPTAPPLGNDWGKLLERAEGRSAVAIEAVREEVASVRASPIERSEGLARDIATVGGRFAEWFGVN
jgi:hypothetical protein